MAYESMERQADASDLPHAAGLLCRPGGGNPLQRRGDALVDPDTGARYPIAQGIPRLLPADYDRDLAAHYDRIAQGAPDFAAVGYRFSLHYRRLLRVARLALAELPDGAAIADIGCGHGSVCAPETSRLSVYGVDLSAGLLQQAARRGHLPVQGCATALPFADGSLDAAISVETVQHLRDPAPLLAEAARVVRPGGRIVVSALNGRSWARRLNRAVMGLKQGDFVYLRSAGALAAGLRELPVALERCLWVMSPSPWAPATARPRSVLEPLALNVFLVARRMWADRATAGRQASCGLWISSLM